MPTDADNLLDRAVHGDREALIVLLRRHEPAVRLSLAGAIPKRHQGILSEDDVIQETFAAVVFKIGQFAADAEASFVAWLRTVARRNLRDAVKSLDRLKRGRPEPRVSLSDLPGEPTDGGTSPSCGADRPFRDKLLLEALEVLPADYARVIELYDLKGWTAQQVGDDMGRSQGAVFMLRARGLERLRDELGPTSHFFSSSS